MSNEQFKITWIDHHRAPESPANPNFPNGRDFDFTQGKMPYCTVQLEHPTKGCGIYVIYCLLCEIRVAATTAGRPDDPSKCKIPCKLEILELRSREKDN